MKTHRMGRNLRSHTSPIHTGNFAREQKTSEIQSNFLALPLRTAILRHAADARRHLLALLLQRDPARGDVRAPRRRPNKFDPARVLEDIDDLLERLAGRLGEHEEGVDEHADAEDAEHDVGAPLDVDERRRHEVAEGEVEGPVGRRGKRDGLAAHAQRVEFGRVDPGYRAPGRRVRGDEQVRAGDDGFGGRALDEGGGFGFALDAVGLISAVGGQNAAVGEEPGGHQGGSDEQGRSAAPAVDVK